MVRYWQGYYDQGIECDDIETGGVFQDIQKRQPCVIPSDATDPLDHLSTILLRTTPMAPVHVGSDHYDGMWLPIRRTRVATVATAPDDETIVDDPEPFKVGDTVQAIDVAGPATAVTDLGAITAINYTTGLITTTNAADSLNVNDWIEVTENGSVDTDHFIGTEVGEARQVGLLQHPMDMRIDAKGDVQMMGGAVVIEGQIEERHIHFNVLATNDQILIDELEKLSPLNVHVIQRPNV